MTIARFAPSPTGLLHVGNARIALANFLFARHTSGQFLLRLDDTDRARSTEAYAAAIEHDLHWLGIEWDDKFHQSDRLDCYRQAAERLRQAGRLYPCFESEEELKAKREAQIRRGLPPVYDRAMLKLTSQQRTAAEANGKRPYWRFLLSDAIVAWTDLVLGPRQVKLPTISDPVLIRADETPLYTFTSVVDDIDTAVTHVIRGEDHVTNTAVQLDLAAALGAEPERITFAHLPLLTDAEGGKLSKRLDSLTLRSLARDGVEPAAIVAYLARLGSSEDPEPLPIDELARFFDLTHFSRSAARFDGRQLLALNRRVLHELPFAAVKDRLPPGATEAFWLAVRGNLDLFSEVRRWWEVVTGAVSGTSAITRQEQPWHPGSFVRSGGAFVPPVIEGEREFLRKALALLPPEPWDETVWTNWTDALRAATGRRGRALFQPLRLALTGEEHGPELRALLPLIGRPRVADRLQVAAS